MPCNNNQLLLLCLLLVNSFCYSTQVEKFNILALFPHPGKSHMDVFEPLMKGLAKKGHNVTVISHFPLEEPMERYHDLELESSTGILVNVRSMDRYTGRRLDKYLTIQYIAQYGKQNCQAALESPGIQGFLENNDGTKFDVILAEVFNTDCFLGFVHKFKAPLIGISSCTMVHQYNERVGNPTHPAYIPYNFMDYSDKLTFLERAENLLIGVLNQFYYNTIVYRQDEEFTKRFFGEDTPPLNSIILNTSLLFVNSHFSLNLPRPLVPGVIEVGGIHIGDVKKLPKVSENPNRYFEQQFHLHGYSEAKIRHAVVLDDSVD